MKKIVLYGLFLIGSLCSCQRTSSLAPELIDGVSFLYKERKIHSKFSTCDSAKSGEEFLQFEDIYYSDDYILKDSILQDFNDDGKIDWAIILSPKIQEVDSFMSPCYQSVYNKRLLIMGLSENEKSKLVVNENLIPNMAESQSEPLRGMEFRDKHLELKFYMGTSRRCYFNLFFVFSNNQSYLKKVEKECYLTDLSKSEKENKEYSYSDSTDISKIKGEQYLKFPQW